MFRQLVAKMFVAVTKLSPLFRLPALFPLPARKFVTDDAFSGTYA